MPSLRTPHVLRLAALGLATAGLATLGPIAPTVAQPATAPAAPMDDAVTQPMAEAVVTPDPAVQPLLDQMSAAYKDLKTLDLAGTVTADFDAAGQTQNDAKAFTAAFKAPNQFRHELPKELTVVGTGQAVFIYDPTQNVYLQQPTPPGPTSINTLPPPAVAILQSQNVSLFLALSGDPVGLLGRGADTIAGAPAVMIDGREYPAVLVQTEGNQITLALDPDTKLVRRMTVDLAAGLKAQGVPAVNKAGVTIDYTKSDAGADVPAERFAFTPPDGATDIANAPPAGAPGGMQGQPQGQQGQPTRPDATAPATPATPAAPDTGMPEGSK